MKSNSALSSSTPLAEMPLDALVPMWRAGVGGPDRCDNCSAVLKETEKRVGLCGRCQKLAGGGDDAQDVSIFMPEARLHFAPAPPSSLLVLSFISPQFDHGMAKKMCPNGDGHQIKESKFPRGWKCSNHRCPYAKYG